MKLRTITTQLLLLLLLTNGLCYGASARIKDIAKIKNVRGNQLYGYGLVIGLNGSGDTTTFNLGMQLMTNMLQKFDVSTRPDELQSSNIAAVIVTANIPPFSKEGNRIDVTVSCIGDAKSLEGGILLQTPLMGADGEIYAVAQGPISVAGFNFESGGTRVQRNHTTVARIPNGAYVEREIPTTLVDDSSHTIVITLHEPDFTTASRLATVVNKEFPDAAAPLDAASISIKVPDEYQTERKIVYFISKLESLVVEPDAVARVIINERTGTIVAGTYVRISKVAISHGDMTLTIREHPLVSQPTPFSQGQTVIATDTDINVDESKSKLSVVPDGASVADVAAGLNELGVSVRDLIAIFQAIKQAGALHAELIIM